MRLLKSPHGLGEWSLLLANTAPVVGVVGFEWQLLPVLLLYWCETGVLGLVGLGRMNWSILCYKRNEQNEDPLGDGTSDHGAAPIGLAWGVFILIGLPLSVFMLVILLALMNFHATLLLMLFTQPGTLSAPSLSVLVDSLQGVWIGVAILLVGQIIALTSTARDRARAKHRASSPGREVASAYKRIIIPNMIAVLAAGLILMLHAPVAAVVLLAAAKTVADLWSLQGERVGIDREVLATVTTPNDDSAR